MTTYKESVGTAVRDIAGEDGVTTGQLWYDTNANEYKYRQQFAGNAWSSGGNLNTARGRPGGAGSGNTNALAFGGNVPGSPTVTGNTEAYDGSSWTEVNDLNTARAQGGGVGATNTAALSFGGILPPTTPNNSALTELWNGTNWTEVNDMNAAKEIWVLLEHLRQLCCSRWASCSCNK